MRNDARHGARFAEVLAQPRLAPAHDGISVRLLSDQRLVRQLALVVPLQQVQLRNPHRLARAHMTRDDVEREVVPRRRAAGRDDAPRLVGEAEVRLGMEADLRVPAPEEIAIAPVRRGVAAVEQSRLRQHQRPGARRVHVGPGCVSRPDPRDEIRVSTTQVLVRPEPQLRQDDDVGVRDVADGGVRLDGYPVTTPEPLAAGPDHADTEGRCRHRRARQRLPHVPGGAEHVHHAVERRPRGLGDGDDGGLERGDWRHRPAPWHRKHVSGKSSSYGVASASLS